MIIDLESAATDPSAVWDLVALAEESNNHLQFRAHAPKPESTERLTLGLLYRGLVVREGR